MSDSIRAIISEAETPSAELKFIIVPNEGLFIPRSIKLM